MLIREKYGLRIMLKEKELHSVLAYLYLVLD
jgi:hypothetical protein